MSYCIYIGRNLTADGQAYLAGYGDEPSSQIQDLHQVGERIQAERSIPHTDSIASVLNLMPSGVLGTMMKRMDFLASNVPGVNIPMYLVGSKVLQFYPFGPTAVTNPRTWMLRSRSVSYGLVMTLALGIYVFLQASQSGRPEQCSVWLKGSARPPISVIPAKARMTIREEVA